LVRQVIDSIPMRRILRLKDSYSRLGIDHVAAKVGKPGPDGLAQIISLLNDMVSLPLRMLTEADVQYEKIANQAIRATITTVANTTSPVMVFHDDNTHRASGELRTQVSDVDRMAKWLEAQLSHANREMGISPAYLKKVRSVCHAPKDKLKRCS